MNKFSLNPAQIEHYHREGYVVVPKLFTPEDLKKADDVIREMTRMALTKDCSKIMELEPELVDGERVARRIYDPFEQHEVFESMAKDSRILDRIESLIGPDIGIHNSKLNMKPARVGSIVDWHQDLTYFPHTNPDLVTTLVYLDDATVNNGCLQVLPRHHHHFFNHDNAEGIFSGSITEDLDSGRFGRPVPLEAPAGSVIFMHCVLPHSSLPNRSDRARRTLIYEYRAADSFPIYYGEKTVDLEIHAHHLRGNRAKFARMGNISPLVPSYPGKLSLYQLQELSRTEQMTGKKLISV
jgi:phytanoyl-CoA hydroxylase